MKGFDCWTSIALPVVFEEETLNSFTNQNEANTSIADEASAWLASQSDLVAA